MSFIPPDPTNWMLMSQAKVLESFHNIPGAFSDCFEDERFVYVPGTRKDNRALIVAHCDTVWGEGEIKLGFHNDVFYSKNRFISTGRKKKHKWKSGTGIGADDRAGCAIAWELRRTGHSILITSGEEIGGICSKNLMKNKYWADKINNEHSFVVQFDRRGRDDLVFYDVGTNNFVKYVEQQTGYIPKNGTFTDICVLCEKICGVNISVGYYNEHDCEEKLVYSQWLNTLYTAYKWLSQEKLPRFELDQQDAYTGPKAKTQTSIPMTDELAYDLYSSQISQETECSIREIICPWCHTATPNWVLSTHQYICPKCNRSCVS